MSAQAGQGDEVNTTSVESTTQNDYIHEVKRRKEHISNSTSKAAKMTNKQVQTSETVEQLLRTAQNF
jgi:Tfp pilus assembly protein PilV